MKKIWWGLGGLAAVIGIGGVATAAWLNSVSGVGSAYKQLNADAKAVEHQHPVHAVQAADPSSTPPASSPVVTTPSHAAPQTAAATQQPSSDPPQAKSSSTNPTANQQAIWYPSSPHRVAIEMPLPSGYHWQQVKDMYRSWGALWTQLTPSGKFGQSEQVALSLITEPVNQFSSPPSWQILDAGGNSSAKVWIWAGSKAQTIHGTELVGLGTTQKGWRGVWSNPNTTNGLPQGHTLLINITLPYSKANAKIITHDLAHWVAIDTYNHAIDAVQEKTTCTVNCWSIPAWPLNPLQNNNYPKMPKWLQ